DKASQQERDNILLRMETLENEVENIKKEIHQLNKQKGKIKINDDVGFGTDQTEEIYRKLNSLYNRLGRNKDTHDHNMAIFKAISEFLEQHVRSITLLSGVPEDIWGTEKERNQVISQLN
ncbi:hypothetical protein KI387_003436, partial [Taxus chinensis]